MPEPVDRSEDKPLRESNDVKSKRVWEPIVRAQKEGKELTPEQQRALEIRRTSLSFIDAIGQLIEDPSIKVDAAREAEVTSQYWQALLKLQDLGIQQNMHVGEPEEFFDDPNNRAEYVAGQLMDIEGDKLPNVRQAMYQIQEHSEGSIPVNEELNVSLMPTKDMSPMLKNWIVTRSMVNIAHVFLASDLDRPSQS